MKISSKTKRKSPTRIGNNATALRPDSSKNSGAAMKHRRLWFTALLGLLLLVPSLSAQKKRDEAAARTVQGSVTSADNAAVSGAVVQLKNTKTLQIRSFITKEDGAYYFNGLSPDIDYELKADFQGASSGTKTLSSFDDRKQAIINLQIKKK